MTKDAAETIAGLAGGLYVAPVATAMPATVGDPIASPWVDLGYFRTDGLTKSKEVTSADIKAWPGGVTVRTLITESVEGIQGTLMQILSQDAWQLANGGGTFSGGVYTPPVGDEDYNVAAILEILDGDNIVRFLVPKVKNVASLAMPFPSEDVAEAPLDLRFQATSGAGLYTVQTNLDAWDYVAP